MPRRPWHGASSSELVLLRIAVELAPGGVFGDGIARLAGANTAAVLIAVAELAEGRYIDPAGAGSDAVGPGSTRNSADSFHRAPIRWTSGAEGCA